MSAVWEKPILFMLLLLAWGPALGRGAPPTVEAPYGIKQRVAWTTSKITGSPDPPLPYRTERIFPKQTFDKPVEAVFFPASDRLCVVEQLGKIHLLPKDPQTAGSEVIFDGAKQVRGLTAIYGLAFDPKFARNRYCYITYILEKNLPEGTHVSRFRVTNTSPPRIDPASETVLLKWRSGGHNGGSLKFGPDGYLYISTGDGSPPSPPDIHKTGQDNSDLLGSVLRIDVHQKQGKLPYAIPSDNPLAGEKNTRGEVWAYGFRNPWRMSFDRRRGDLWLGDVGWQLWEMVHRVEAGGNYGWSISEGPQSVHPEGLRGPAPISAPVVAYPRSAGASVTGGYFYYGKRLPALQGAYLYGDYVTGKIWSLRHDGQTMTSHRELSDTTFAIIAFFETPDGEVGFLDYNGGTIQQLVPNQQEDTSASFPRRLSATGLFSSTKQHLPAAGVLPFSINAAQWQDYATAERFIGVPATGSVSLRIPTARVPLDWGTFPQNMVLVKTLSLEMERGNPASRRRIETQILHLRGDTWRGNSGEWAGYTYIWNRAQTDAVLAPAAGQNLEFSVRDPSAPGGERQYRWHIASRTECYQCHNPWTGYRLAFTPAQLNKVHDYQGLRDNQLRALKHIGLISSITLETADKKEPTPTKNLDFARLANPHDHAANLDARARSYLHVNCAHCHRFGGGGTATINLRFSTPLAETGLIDVRPTQGTFSIPHARLLSPTDPYHSILYYRMAKLGQGRMPYVGSKMIDPQGVQLLRDWITNLPKAGDSPNLNIAKRHTKQLAALQQLEQGESPEAMIGQLLGTTTGAMRLMEAVAGKRLPATMRQTILTRAMKHPEPHIRDLFERFVPDTQRIQRLGSLVTARQILDLSGNARQGERLFAATSGVQCKNCHQIKKVGTAVGPDLSHVGKQMTRLELLQSILKPSEKINPKFVTYLVETTDGRVLTGLLVKKTDQRVILRDAQNKLIELPASQVEFLVPQPKSLMPDLLFKDMSAQQLADLLAYLEDLK